MKKNEKINIDDTNNINNNEPFHVYVLHMMDRK